MSFIFFVKKDLKRTDSCVDQSDEAGGRIGFGNAQVRIWADADYLEKLG
ncbi:hypothetical protein [Paraburkholderia fungorum]|nr:hypothetical protein [Paraburkholderia fungorum]